MKKKVSLPIVIAIVFIVAAIVFSLAFVIARNNMNKKLKDLNEKQAMFSALADADNIIRENSFYTPDEEKLREEIIEGYIEGYEGRILYLEQEEYKNSKFAAPEYKSEALADGMVAVFLTEAQYDALENSD